MSQYESIETDGMTIESNTRTAAQMAESFANDPEKPAPKAEVEEPEETPVEGEDPKKGKHSRLLGRMLEATQRQADLTKERDEIARRADDYKRRLDELEARRTPEAPRAPEKPPAPEKPAEDLKEGRPKLADFDSIEDHAEAMAEWIADRRHKARQAEVDKANVEKQSRSFYDAQQKSVEAFTERARARVEADPAFASRQISQDVLGLLPEKPFEPDHRLSAKENLGVHLTMDEAGLDLMVHFTDHPEDLDRILKLPTLRMFAEVGRISERLGHGAITATPAKSQSSKAAPPARPVAGGPPSVTTDPSKMSLEDSFKFFADMDRKRR